MTFGETIKQLRKERGLTQEELCEAIGTSAYTLRTWEKDRTIPNIQFIERLSSFFQTSFELPLNPEASQGEPGPSIRVQTSTLTESTNVLLEKYLVLDEHGKHVVNLICDVEYERVLSQNQEEE